MRVWKAPGVRGIVVTSLLGVASAFINSLALCSQIAFATEELSVSLSPSLVELNVSPERLMSTTQTITASTTNPTGYTLSIHTLGSSTALVNNQDSSLTISTFSLPFGSISLSAEYTGYGYGYSVDGGSSYFPVPDPSSNGANIFKTRTSGTNEHELVFGTKIERGTTAGSYTNTFVVIAIANDPFICGAENICYRDNGDDVIGEMPDQSVGSNSSVALVAPNYLRPGYGFAGWNTEEDGTGTDYGPGETIATGDLSKVGLTLYAKWLEPEGLLQNWTGCDAMATGGVTALRDFRDNEVYVVSKLADDNCWITENSRLNPASALISKANTNSPTEAFVLEAPMSSTTSSMCASDSSDCFDKVSFNSNNLNHNMVASPTTNNNSSSWYSYGMMYNWYTATAGNGTYEKSSGNVPGDICPAGWHLPTGGANGEYAALNNAVNDGNTRSDAKLRKYPNNFIWSGDYNTNASTGRGTQGRYWSATPSSNTNAYRLGNSNSTATATTNSWNKWAAFAVRCITNDGNTSLMGNVHYEANGGDGTMSDDTNVNLYTAAAKPNGFTHSQGHTFAGWNTSSDGSGTEVVNRDMVAEAAQNMGIASGETLTLYAMWGEEMILDYDANGGQGAPDTSVVVGVGAHSFVVSSVIPTRHDYTFLGWSTDSSSATAEYVAGDVYTTSLKNDTLYAVWSKDECGVGQVCYRGNDADAGVAANQAVSGNTATLHSPDYSRDGYGFAGWNTEPDGSGTSYGAGATITVGDLSNEGLNVYARWIASAGSLQGWSGCNAMQAGEVTALTDLRDNDTYAVAKLADGNCWMIENLRLNPSTAEIAADNTNLPTASFLDSAPSSSPSSALCNGDNSACIDQIAFYTNNVNRSLTASYNKNNNASSWYSYGVLYNWYAATAGNGTFSLNGGNVAGDICPSGWRLPTSGNGGEYNTLNTIVNGGSTTSDAGLREYPNNLIWSGDHNASSDGGRGSYARYWSATASDANNAFRFGFQSNAVTPLRAYNKWDAFAIRCIAK